MSTPLPSTPRSGLLLLRADATSAIGVGHAMRCLALGQEAVQQGLRVVLTGDVEVEWVAEAYRQAGIEIMPPPQSPAELSALATKLDASAAVLDGYLLPATYGQALRDAGVRVAAMVDGEYGSHQIADVYIDQNPGTSPLPVSAPTAAVAGAEYTLFRDDVLAARATRASALEPARPASAPRRVVAVFGGTDPMGAAPVVAPLIVAAAHEAGVNIELEVVTRDATAVHTGIAQVGGLPPGSTVHVLPALSDLAARAAVADLVVTASGSTVWELLCIGTPSAVVCVIDNQTPGYDFSTNGDYVAGLGHLSALRSDDLTRQRCCSALTQALTDDVARKRRSQAGAQLLDGEGRRRALAAILPG